MIKNAVINLVSLIVVLMTIVINFFVINFMIGYFWGLGTYFGIFPDYMVFHQEHLPAFITAKYYLFFDAIFIFFSLLVIGFTPIGRRILFRLAYKFRQPTQAENARLQHILTPVFNAAGKDLAKYKIYISEEDIQNAYAAGWNEMAVTRRLLLSLTNDELQGVLSHELGHLNHGDGVWTLIINSFNLVTIISCKIIKVSLVIAMVFTRIPFIGLIIAAFSWMLVVFSWIIAFLQLLPQRIGIILNREVEYRADHYAAEIGFGNNIIKAFNKMEAVKKPGLWERLKYFLNSTHPPTYYRIKKLQTALNTKNMSNPKQVPLVN